MKSASSLQKAVRVFCVVAATVALVVALTLPTMMVSASSDSDVALFGRHRGHRHCGRRCYSSCETGGCYTGGCTTGGCTTGGCSTGGCTVGGCN
ncbi:hypothetical protein LOC68_08710 [Blastopirellula sp. JC732]|uniref:Uncharacterized protein n=1 Tax=Blastopirellula sediminis TaxID=2894196 RepID=A0A9X1MN08_9BACT|nr:hypothetical protein [Blastopirellula sediminis]MCC9608749.1 hypothetical protein [Blastopirellula sediminis]MCC9628474.1 hypothetical protein [Blastopirellula sediminis]